MRAAMKWLMYPQTSFRFCLKYIPFRPDLFFTTDWSQSLFVVVKQRRGKKFLHSQFSGSHSYILSCSVLLWLFTDLKSLFPIIIHITSSPMHISVHTLQGCANADVSQLPSNYISYTHPLCVPLFLVAFLLWLNTHGNFVSWPNHK